MAENNKFSQISAKSWSIGIASGLALGIILGLLMDNISVGIAIGVGVGVAFAAAHAGYEAKKKKPNTDSDGSAPDANDGGLGGPPRL